MNFQTRSRMPHHLRKTCHRRSRCLALGSSSTLQYPLITKILTLHLKLKKKTSKTCACLSFLIILSSVLHPCGIRPTRQISLPDIFNIKSLPIYISAKCCCKPRFIPNPKNSWTHTHSGRVKIRFMTHTF